MATFLTLPVPFWVWLAWVVGAGLWTYSAIVASRHATYWRRLAMSRLQWGTDAVYWREQYARLHNRLAHDPQFWYLVEHEEGAGDAAH